MKRARSKDEEEEAEVKPFKFSFGLAEASESTTEAEKVESSSLRIDEAAKSPGIYARVRISVDPSAWGSTAVSSLALPVGARVRIDWEDAGTVGPYVCVSRCDGTEKARGIVHASSLELLATERDVATRTWLSGAHESEDVAQYDQVFSPGNQQALAFDLEPGLAPFAWPLGTHRFRDRCYTKRKALCVHATRRMTTLAADYGGFEVKAMLAEASRVVVWMKEAPAIPDEEEDGGADTSSSSSSSSSLSGRAPPPRKMQYIEASPDVGAAAYAAGHSLYFNPSAPVQEKYITALAADLGLDIAGGSVENLGDVEIFAVRGRHATPWHFDAQENFTVQCRGTKRWRLKKGPLHDPLTNLHPLSSNTAALANDRRLHRACTDAPLDPPQDDDPSIVTVLLRPGSTLYIPAGFWHAVDAEDVGGSVSINFSMGGARWSDVLLRGLAQRLWRTDARWRGRVSGGAGGLEGARAYLSDLLASLPAALGSLGASDLLPDVLAGSASAAAIAGLAEEEEEDEEEGGGEGGASAASVGQTRYRIDVPRDAPASTAPPASESNSSVGCNGAHLSVLGADAAARWIRTPLAVLCMDGGKERSDSIWGGGAKPSKHNSKQAVKKRRGDAEPSMESGPASSGYLRLSLYAAPFGGIGPDFVTTPPASTIIEIPRILEGAARFMLALKTGSTSSIQDLVESVAKDGGSGRSRGGGGESLTETSSSMPTSNDTPSIRIAIRSLVDVLTARGFLKKTAA